MRYRNDDINRYSCLAILRKIHGLFLKYNKIHTIAVEMKDIWDNKGIWYWMQSANLEIGLHGWTHRDYSILTEQVVYTDLLTSLDYYKKHGGKKEIKVFYPPWNRTSKALEKVCGQLGLTVDTRKGGEVYNFHWWTFINSDRNDFEKLEKVLNE